MDNRKFYLFLASFFAGIFFASYIRLGTEYFLACLLLVVVFLSQKRYFFLICLLFFVIGGIRFAVFRSADHPLDAFLGNKVEFEGIIANEPEAKELKQRFYFKPNGISDKFVVSLPPYPSFEYGDKIFLKGTLILPENFESFPGGPIFDYVSYLSKDGVRYVLDKPGAKLLSRNNGNSVISFLISLKKSFLTNIEASMPEPHASLVAGILLGEKGSLPQSLIDGFRRSGLTHILVLSGSNVSIVAGSLMSVLSFLPRALGRSLGAVSIILFALMTGASSTTVRASMMALIFMMSKGAGRNYDVSRALLLAAFFMVLQNPAILAFDIGFQLSFISTLALIYVCPIASSYLEWVTEKFGLRDMISTTIATQVFILPFMLYKMGEASVISLVTNILVLPVVPWSMFLGFTTGIFGFFGKFVAMPFSLAGDILLSWMIKVVSFFGGLSIASAKFPIGIAPVLFIYLIYGFFIWRWHLKNFSPRSASLD